MTTMEMPHVSECTVESCSYNVHHDCHAFAINVSGQNGSADCGTFIPLSTKGGLERVTSMVGACQRADCAHNRDLECTAPEIRVGAGGDHNAHCLTYQTR
ncbi:MAG: DUF1540 domain-containing protein [Rhodococcus sp.]|nr:DUF1540 domain-containing protein [Rhodococcus sp. (in: high G+C Gram-positive bacteria)]